uniref:phosphatidylinositol-3,5-bisphosphate 3-phosphatase n=1 Tax=Oncorhynchus tshawytscha TaxID=74940 RepID=A0A8C8LX54_ONCTS
MCADGPPSLEYIQAKDLFPPKELVSEDDNLQVPFPALQGEGVEYLGRADDAVIAISNYRLHIKFKDSVINVPLMLIESVESRHMFQLHITCKDSKVVRCHFSTFKQCQEWLRRLNRAIAHPGRLEDLFALAYHAWCLGSSTDDEDQHLHLCRPGDHVRQRLQMEVKRMGFDMQNAWRVSDINLKYKLCSSYPQQLLVPVWITDKELESVGSFRSSNRIPVVVYRHQRNGAVIARCSQPEISWWGWRNTEDEYLVTSIAKACLMDPGTRITCEALACSQPRGEGPDSSDSDFDSSLTGCPGPDANTAPQKLLILDARSYTAAVANRAKGGGCECEEYYPNCEVMFMGMANIHSIRNSFQSLRAVCSQIPDPGNWLSALESTRWLQHLSVMLKAATLVCSAVEREGRPVLVHCSDGWDRTPQIVALAKILLDPFYRTLEGFQVLVETEWLDYGHKFGDRCGHQEDAVDVSEQCPVFLQWLDCVHQLFKQFPCLFEFNEAFLVLQPVCHTRALQLWTAVYLPTSSPCTSAEDAMELYLSPSVQGDELTSRSLDRLPKTRSMDNLVSAFENGVALTRTSSDPNLNKHCQEARTAHGLEPMASVGGGASPDSPEDISPDTGLESDDSEVEPVTQTPPTTPVEREQREEAVLNGPITNGLQNAPSASAELPAPEQLVPTFPTAMEDSTKTLTDEAEVPPTLPPRIRESLGQPKGKRTESMSGRNLVPLRECVVAVPTSKEAASSASTVPPVDNSQAVALRRPVSQNQLRVSEELSLLGSHWDSVQGMVQSACSTAASHSGLSANLSSGFCRALQPTAYQRSSWLSAVRSSSGYAAIMGPTTTSSPPTFSTCQLLPASPQPHPAYLDDDGLPVPVDAVQQRLRQMEAGYKQEVEVLRSQVRQLQMRLERKQYSTPPSEPDVDYEDDITCLRESDDSDEEDSLSDHSEDRFSEGSWDRVEQKDTEVTRWVPDHMASHCFNCDCEFWMAKRRHHCRNCGNVFCKDCCHLKLPIPDQQLYDPVLVCNVCCDLLLEARNREIRSQQLKKPIATASS